MNFSLDADWDLVRRFFRIVADHSNELGDMLKFHQIVNAANAFERLRNAHVVIEERRSKDNHHLVNSQYIKRVKDYRAEHKCDLMTAKIACDRRNKSAPVVPLTDNHVVQCADDIEVDNFAYYMKEKLALSRVKGRGGWQEADINALNIMLREHIEKGDPIDVANFCMFLQRRGERIAPVAAKQSCPKCGGNTFYGNRCIRCFADEHIIAAKQVDEWQPIETAPLHGIILVTNGNGTWPCEWKKVARYGEGFYELGKPYCSPVETATHWMSLPKPPTVSRTLAADTSGHLLAENSTPPEVQGNTPHKVLEEVTPQVDNGVIK